MESYLVILSREQELPVTDLAPALAEALERPPAEIVRQLRERPWILIDDVPAVALDAIFDALAKEQVSAKAIPAVHMPVLEPPLRVRYGDPLPAGLFLQRAAPPAPAVLPWAELMIVSAGLVTVALGETVAANIVDGGTPGSAPLAAGRKKESDHLLVDLICRSDPPLRLRIDGGDFNYDYLGERMRPSSRENLRLLLADISTRAPDAVYTERTRKLMEGEPTSAYRFRTLGAFETYNRWVLQATEEEAPETEA